MTRTRDERGLAMVEAPLCIAVVLLLLMGVITITQVVWTHLDLAEAARDATRYATRVEFAPGSTGRHRTEDEVEDWVRTVAEEAGVDTVAVTVSRPGEPEPEGIDLQDARTGDIVTVTVTRKVVNPVYLTAAGITNAMAGVLGAGRPFDPEGVTVNAEAETYVE